LAPPGSRPFDEARPPPPARTSLTSPELPTDVCVAVPAETRWLLIGTPEIFDYAFNPLAFGLERHPLSEATEDWFKLAWAHWSADPQSMRPPCRSALLIARLETSSSGTLR
jgi:hypothetical protein